jgi:hypothetical protein
LEVFVGIEQAKKEIEDGIQKTIKMMNELENMNRGILSNWKYKSIKLGTKIKKNNELLLYKSCIIKAINTNWINSTKEAYVKYYPTRKITSQAMEIVQKDETRIHCALCIIEHSKIFDYLKLFTSLYHLSILDERKILFVISDSIEKKAISIIKLMNWNIEIKNMKA